MATRKPGPVWPWAQVMRMLGLDIPWPAEDSGQPVRDAPASERSRLFDEVTSLLLDRRSGRLPALPGGDLAPSS